MRVLDRLSPYWLWALLSVPAATMANGLATSDNPRIVHMLLHPSGEFAARFLIIAMIATPLSMLLRGWRGPRWLVRNRRYFGVAAFGYAALHTIFYVVDEGTLQAMLADATKVDIWTGWFAFAIFLPLAATSMDAAVRAMGPRWKSLQRWTYAAAVLTFLHWASLHNWNHPAAAFIHFAPLAALTAYRLWWNFLRPRPTRGAAA
jgi:sulfoxide reductase heme-binding subunit YedZ